MHDKRIRSFSRNLAYFLATTVNCSPIYQQINSISNTNSFEDRVKNDFECKWLTYVGAYRQENSNYLLLFTVTIIRQLQQEPNEYFSLSWHS